jgi:hypothetical protein
MQIRTSGSPTKVTPAVCRKALRYYGQIILSKRLYETISIKLVFREHNKTKADCVWEDCPVRGKHYTINVREKLSFKEMMLCLAHEMVHIMQWRSGVMKDSLRDPNKCTCRNKTFAVSESGYWFYPWEVEAYGLEIGLYHTFKKELKDGIRNGRRPRRRQRRQTYKRY